MNLDELTQIKDSLAECKPSVEDFSWGPTYELAEKRRVAALKVIRRAIKNTTRIKNKDRIRNLTVKDILNK